MTLTRNHKIAIVAVAIATSFVVGRYTAPVKIVTETKTVEVEKKTDNKKADRDKVKHVKTTTTEVDKPDGSKVITKTTTDDSTDLAKTSDASTDDTSKSSDVTKTVTKETSKWHLSSLVAQGFGPQSTSIPSYGISVSKDILGPLNIGIFGLTNLQNSGILGLSVGISF